MYIYMYIHIYTSLMHFKIRQALEVEAKSRIRHKSNPVSVLVNNFSD